MHVENKNECTGCGTCYNACPVGAITMQGDKYGFYKPVSGAQFMDKFFFVDGTEYVRYFKIEDLETKLKEKQAELETKQQDLKAKQLKQASLQTGIGRVENLQNEILQLKGEEISKEVTYDVTKESSDIKTFMTELRNCL